LIRPEAWLRLLAERGTGSGRREGTTAGRLAEVVGRGRRLSNRGPMTEERSPRDLRTALRKRILKARCALGARAELDRPVFVVGCGRSGTTVLGDMLSRHSQVTYLNEYRQLWTRAYPETDIWSERALERGGRIDLTAEICSPERDRKLRVNFYCETLARGGSRLVEKLPINSFRLGFVDAVFPGALYVHLMRNGLEVARSIERMSESELWYGHDDAKWKLLVRYARADERYAGLDELCDTYRKRGLLEWRMSVEAATEFLDGVAPERQLSLTYEELLEDPPGCAGRMEDFAGLRREDAVVAFAEANLQRRSPRIEVTRLSEAEETLAGELMRRLGYLPA
jgi:hypothetical protein